MKLVSAELNNFCQYKHTAVKFVPGLNAILGRNGSGKSNLVKAIYAAVTGDFGRNDGVKTDNICQFAEPNAVSRIRTVLEHGGSTLEITRSLRPVSTRLRVTASGAAPLEVGKAQEATEAIANILGVSSRMLADYVFVDQWSIFDFLSMMPAERAKAFQRLFRTERAEVLWKLIGDHHDSIVIPTPGIDKDLVIKRLTEAKESYENLCKDYKQEASKEATYKPADLLQTITDYQRKQAAEKEAEDLTRRLEELDRTVEALGKEATKLCDEARTIDDYLVEERNEHTDAWQSIATWRHYNAVESNRTNLNKQLTTIAKSLQILVPPTKPDIYIKLENKDPQSQPWYTEYSEVIHEKLRLQRLIGTHEKGITVCESCGTLLQGTKEDLADLKCRLDNYTAREREMERQHEVSRAYDHDARLHQEHINNLLAKQSTISAQLADIVDVAKPDKSLEEIEAFTKQYEQLTREHEKLKVDLHKVEKEYEGKRSVALQLREDLAAKRQIQELLKDVTKSSAELAAQQLKEYDVIKSKRVTLQAQIQVKERAIADDEAALVKLAEVEKQAVDMREWANYTLDLRHIFHRDNLPRLVAQNYLELMEDEINNLLVRFGSTFSVRADESLSFMATFHDGRKVPAARLSGGEKVLLALAFRVAVNDVFAKDLGLLVLDEPTAGLDEGNLACLRIAIERLKELSAARGLQVVMITHERELHNLFDNVIEVGKDT
jgi:DNA repair exonuclease SbcCD ATPase subunit